MKSRGLAGALGSALVLAGPPIHAQDRFTPVRTTAREASHDGAFAGYGLPARVRSGVARLGFNGVSQAEFGVLLARRLGRALLIANLRYGQGLGSAERSGSASVASLVHAAHAVQVGVESQFECDLERNADEPAREADFRGRAGPLLNVTYDVFAVTAGGGISALRYRLASATAVSGIAYLGVGAVF